MRKAFFSIFTGVVLTFIPSYLRADIYVRGVLHINGGYRYGHNVPDSEVVNEWWFSKDKMAYSSTGWNFDYFYGGSRDVRFIWDREKMRVLAIDLSGKSYLDFSLSADLVSCVDENAAGWMGQFLLDGRVEKTGRTETVLERSCDEYRVSEWMIRQDDRFFDRRRTLLVTRDVPFDWRMADDLVRWVASFVRPQPRYISELKKMEGFILSSRESVFEGGSEVSFNFRVLEIRETKAPEHLYESPEGFTGKALLAVNDLSNLRAIFFLYSLY